MPGKQVSREPHDEREDEFDHFSIKRSLCGFGVASQPSQRFGRSSIRRTSAFNASCSRAGTAVEPGWSATRNSVLIIRWLVIGLGDVDKVDSQIV